MAIRKNKMNTETIKIKRTCKILKQAIIAWNRLGAEIYSFN
jgi:hypothetical protein